MSVGSSSQAIITGPAITRVGWQRICAIMGIAFTLLAVGAVVVVNTSPPGLDASAATIIKVYRNHHTEFLRSDFLLALSTFPFMWFLGGLRSALRQQEEPGTLSTIAFGAGMLAAAAILADSALESGFVFKAAGMSGIASENGLVLVVSNTVNILFTFIWLAAAGVVSTTSVSNLRGGFQPRWLAWAGLALSVVMLANSAVLLENGSTRWATLTLVAFAGFLLWTLTTSVYLFLRANLKAASS